MKKSKKMINLLPNQYFSVHHAHYNRYLLLGLLALEIGGFVGGVMIQPKWALKKSYERLANYKEALNQCGVTEAEAKMEALQLAKQEAAQLKKQYETIQDAHFISKQLMDSLLSRVPAGLIVNQLNIAYNKEHGEKQIQMDGTSLVAATIINYATVLEEIFGTEAVVCHFEQSAEQQNYVYQIEIDLQEKPIGDAIQFIWEEPTDAYEE